MDVTPALNSLRFDPRWQPAVSYFQALATQNSAQATADEAAFMKAMQGEAPLVVLDVVMSLRTRYATLAPKLASWHQANPTTTLADFATAPPTSIAPRGGLVSAKRQASIKGIAAALLEVGNSNDSDWKRLTTWAKNAEALRYTHTLDSVGAVKGVGVAAYTYLLMRSGVDTIKPDVRIKEELVKSGLASSTKALDDHSALLLAECMAQELGVTRLWFDQLLWG